MVADAVESARECERYGRKRKEQRRKRRKKKGVSSRKNHHGMMIPNIKRGWRQCNFKIVLSCISGHQPLLFVPRGG